jgi:hypothetical protein
MRCPMTKQFHSKALAIHLLAFGIVLFIGMQTAQAIECSAVMPPHPQRHWSYRLIDGRKCWYQGENNLSKLLLRWPGENSAPSAPDDALALDVSPAVKENRRTVGENPSHHSDPDACCRPQIEELDSFEARWRGLETTVGKN